MKTSVYCLSWFVTLKTVYQFFGPIKWCVSRRVLQAGESSSTAPCTAAQEGTRNCNQRIFARKLKGLLFVHLLPDVCCFYKVQFALLTRLTSESCRAWSLLSVVLTKPQNTHLPVTRSAAATTKRGAGERFVVSVMLVLLWCPTAHKMIEQRGRGEIHYGEVSVTNSCSYSELFFIY